VQGWLRAAGLHDEETVELVFTESEVLLRRPMSPHLRAWSETICDTYDKAFRDIVGL
jgi:hypothetical protein